MPGLLEVKVNELRGEPIPAVVLKLARQLLEWTQGELAERAGVSLRSLVNVESEERRPMRATLERLRLSLEAGGARFFGDGEKVGVFVLPRRYPADS